MRKASRLFEIIQLLRLAKRPVTAAVMAEALEVTVRSIYRDIAALQAMRVPIEGGRGIGYILRPGFDLPPLMFTIEEMEAIVLSLALVERTGDAALKQASKRVNQKIAGAVPPPLREAMEGKALYAWGTIAPSPEGLDLSLVRGAIRDERKLTLDYRDELGRASQRTIRADRAHLLFAELEHRRVVRAARGDPQFPQRPGRALRGGRGLLQG